MHQGIFYLVYMGNVTIKILNKKHILREYAIDLISINFTQAKLIAMKELRSMFNVNQKTLISKTGRKIMSNELVYIYLSDYKNPLS